MLKLVKKSIKGVINKLPYVSKVVSELADYKRKSWVPPGHFYSPVVNVDDVKKRDASIFVKNVSEVYGIKLNTLEQINLLEQLKKYYANIPYVAEPDSRFRYYFDNRYFNYADGTTLYLMLAHFKPRQIIEVGSGFSSALMLDSNESVLNKQVTLTFIEPFPVNRLKKLIRKGDSYILIDRFLQDVNVDVFKKLRKNDILFIDSSHVVKTGGELNYLIFSIFPVLASGVIVHFHDIFYPFEYPREWVYEGRSWNETYFLRCFLTNNPDFEILLFTSYLQLIHSDFLKENMPLMTKDMGSSLYLVKN